MVYRLQYVFLGLCLSGFAASGVQAQSSQGLDIDDEFFSVGLTTGILNIEDFGGEFLVGFESSFKASEDFFLQFNYFQAEASASAFEDASGEQTYSGSERTFSHYDFLVGYNLFQAEFYGDGPQSAISSLYLVGGAGETEFGNENNFTVTLGVGYQFALKRRYVLRLDWRDHIFKSSILQLDTYTHNTQISAGLSYLF